MCIHLTPHCHSRPSPAPQSTLPYSQPPDAHPHPHPTPSPSCPPSLPIRLTEISRRLFDTCGLEPEHKKIPSCGEHYAVLNSEKLANFQLLSPADGHGPLHVQVISRTYRTHLALFHPCYLFFKSQSTDWSLIN
jgi:hypothetical protein